MNMNDNNEKKSDVAKREEEVLAFWDANNIFNKSVEKDAPKGEYAFYDGPPFATGQPHHGHLIGSAIKDAVPRYWTMKGYRVKRQWGWDCHGLPIENIVEKELGTTSKKDILDIGVKKFNNLCRERIFTFIEDWEKMIPRFGRWADMENAYRTMDTDYMESDWWAFKTLYDKKLVYEDYRTMHICPRCETTLSQSEVAEGYKDVKDLSVTVKFELTDEPGTFLLAWTTTPWTLPGNVALAVNKDISYVTIEKKDEENGSAVRFILAKNQLESIFGEDDYKILEEYKGEKLVGRTYTPPFDYYSTNASIKNHENGWKVYAADFVTDESGTGIAHEAPAFGEDDLKLSQEYSLPFVQHVGMDGVFSKEVTDFNGMHVKPIEDIQATDVAIIKYLAAQGLLFSKEKYEHSYPHCWRCDTPLLNYATSSWFVSVSEIKPKLLEYAKDINWSPEHVKEGRWGNWLEGARDWSISRQRFWATTMPVWRCAECKSEKVFGSIAELKEASGVEVTDLHKDVVDEITFPCAECKTESLMHRIPDVLDTWFDSGSVPYASLHYPFENEDEFKSRLPADFIAEGLDQTRTWFYYQHVLSGALFGKPAFKNVVANGMVLAEDGKKMSKRLKNYPDPMYIINTYGADATRLYMLSSPAVVADNLLFSERGVDEWMKKVVMRLENVYTLLALYEGDSKESRDDSENVLDKWIIARTRELVRDVTEGMDTYHLDRATRPLMQFIDDLSTWYVRRSRDRLKNIDSEDGAASRATLLFVLRTYAQVMAPFAPFMADSLWMRLRTEKDVESVHLSEWPDFKDVDETLISDMVLIRSLVSDVHQKREEEGINLRQPLGGLVINKVFSKEMLQIIADEVNVENVTVDESLEDGFQLDTTMTPELKEKGMVRELMRAIQSARKEKGLDITDDAGVVVSGPEEWEVVVNNHAREIQESTRSSTLTYKRADELLVVVELY